MNRLMRCRKHQAMTLPATFSATVSDPRKRHITIVTPGKTIPTKPVIPGKIHISDVLEEILRRYAAQKDIWFVTVVCAFILKM